MSDSRERTYEHFTRVAGLYNDIRTTDVEPILYIKKKTKNKEAINAADIACGGGRYALLLFQHLPGLHLTCIDVNERMIEETASLLRSRGVDNFSTLLSDVSNLKLAEDSMDFIMCSNAIHHFDPMVLLHKAAQAVRDKGYVFLYTRLKSQNARNIWGQFFPGFMEKSRSLYELSDIGHWMNSDSSLTLKSIEVFKFKRKVGLEQLIHQAEKKHYSTFTHYSEGEFREALLEFKKRIESRFTDPNQIEWYDENVMVVFRKEWSGN